ncbi:MAG: Lrp/AsnC family transcriptional regulator [Desulfurococcaceae archaeon]
MREGTEFDELDLDILREIEENPRAGIRDLAKKLKTPKSTIYYRMKKLERSGVIKGYRVVLDGEKLGFEYHVVILIKGKYGPKYHDEVGRLLSKNPYVQAVYYVLGDVDFVVIGRFPRKEVYLAFLEEIINSGLVERSNTIVVAKQVKEDFRLNI